MKNIFILTIKTTALLLILVVLAWLILVIFLKTYYQAKNYPDKNSVSWGTTFSVKYASDLSLDWKEAYLATLNELEPNSLRLIAYWDQVEPKKDIWDFAALDWQINEAQKRNIPFIIAVGRKTPRWPECHIPKWAIDLSQEEIERELLEYEREVIERYKGTKNLLYWQIENEPLVTFGNCPPPDKNLLSKEVSLAKKIDPKTKILVNDGERASTWHHAARYGDVLGLSLYRRMSNKYFSYTLPQIPEFYSAKKTLTKLITNQPEKKYIFTEVGLEPWGDGFDTEEFKNTVHFAHKTRFDTFYAWGVEWWYYQKLKSNPEYWELGEKLFNNASLE